MQSQNDKVIDYYKATGKSYENIWYSPNDLAMHFGYYDKTVKNHSESLVKLNEIMSNIANITPQDYVLDAGCGVGGGAIWLAKNIQCRVTGINIVSYQLQKAVLYACDYDVTHRVNFELQDFTRPKFKDNTFSVVWAQESVCHTERKKEFVQQTYRILKHSGRLVMAEYILREQLPLTTKEQKNYDRWLNGCAIYDLLTLNQYHSLLEEAGFKRIEFKDITQHTKPSLRKLMWMVTIPSLFIKAIWRFKLDSLIKPSDKLALQNILAAYGQYKVLKSNAWKYMIIIAHKD